MPLPRYRWSLTPFPERETFLIPQMLTLWHRAKNLGCEIETLSIAGSPVDPVSLERLNLWLIADGAWRTSLLSHFESERVLGHVLRRDTVVPLGNSGGGRWPAATRATEIIV